MTQVPGESLPMADKTVLLVGKLASMPRREAAQLIRTAGGVLAESPHEGVNLVVVGEETYPLPDLDSAEWLEPHLGTAIERQAVEVLSESQFWQRLGLVDAQRDVHQLYTPAALAQLLGVPVSIIRRWHRRGLIRPVREVRRLPYFDFQEIATARRLAELLAAGVTPASIERQLAALAQYLPGVERPLAQLSIIVRGKRILLRQGDGLVEPGGQLRFDFEAMESAAPEDRPPSILSLASILPTEPPSPEELCQLAADLEDEGRLDEAVEVYRTVLAAGGPRAEVCFQLAELLYRLGDATGARERYYMAIELDENYVEARANLGCVLAETGRPELAVAAFEGALRFHPDYADVHYHLAHTLDELGQSERALGHWRTFLQLAPNSPWSEEARRRASHS